MSNAKVAIPFRNQSKTDLGALVPAALSDRIRERARSRKQSISLVTSEAICLGMGLDPAEFGIPSGAANQA